MYKRLASLSLCFVPLWLGAQTAEDYFHGGAQSYVWEKDREAQAQIFNGLRRYPNDPLLNRMAALLKKEEEKKQQQQQDQQKNQDQQKQPQQKQQDKQQQAGQDQQQKSSDQQKSEQQKKEDEQKQAGNESKEQKQDQQQAQQSAEQSKDKGDAKEQEAAAAQAAGQMTPQQAEQLLDAQKGDEQMLPVQPTGKPVDRNRLIKDW